MCVQPDWTFVLGEQALDLCVPSCSHASSSVFVLGERNLYCLRDNSHIRFMKKLEFNPSCFLPFASGTSIVFSRGRSPSLDETQRGTKRSFKDVYSLDTEGQGATTLVLITDWSRYGSDLQNKGSV